MQKRNLFPLISGITALLLIVFAVIHWNRSVAATRHQVQQHARIISHSVWDLNAKSTAEYLRTVVRHSSYKSITVYDTDNQIFASAEVRNVSPVDKFFIALHLIPEISLSAPIEYKNHTLGRINVIWLNKSVYIYFFALLLSSLCLATINMYLRVLHSRNTLEKEVRNRTKTLQESEQRFRAIFDNHYQLTGLVSPAGILISANQASLDLIDCSEEEIEGMPFCDCPWWPRGSSLHHTVKQAVHEAQAGNFVRTELNYKDLQGNARVIDFSLKPVFNENNQLIYIVPEGRDITVLKQAQKEILREKQFTDAVIESLPGIFYVCNEKLQLIRWNNMFETISGYSLEELDHKDILDFFSHNDRTVLLKKIQERMSRAGSQPIELTARAKDGSNHPFLFSTSVVELDGKNYLVGTGVDISARKKVEAELQQAQKMEAIGTLAGGIAHDFNNILSAIIGYTELSQLETGTNSKISSYLAGIHQAAIRARDLVQQILTFSRKQDNSHLPLQIAPLLKEALRLIRSSIPVTIDIKTHIGAADAMILADPTQIHQIIVNLCTNGYQAIDGEYGTLTVSLQEVVLPGDAEGTDLELKPGRYIMIKVTDTGIGMDKETIQRIFEPYFTTKDIGKGTGLGLALVDSIVNEHGGTITVDSVQGKGTAISVYLPELINTPDLQPEPALEKAADFNRNGSHIVCVDDEPYILGILEEFLTEQGFRVTGFKQSTEALDYICSTTDRIDLVITDMTMPQMNGLELGRRIFKKRPELPVILCTGYSHSINREKAAGEGFACYIEKPLILADLTSAIQKILSKAA